MLGWDAPEDAMAKRVFLHLGTANAGTAYLQSTLWHNADALRRDGLLLPGRLGVHYAAAKGVTMRPGSKRDADGAGEQAWLRLARQSRRWEHDTLIGHELLALATREQARAAKRRLGKDAEVHLIVSVRALNVQLPIAWREQVQSGVPLPFPGFVNRVRDREARGEWFWGAHDVVGIVDRWGPRARASQVHIITVPPGRVDPAVLWPRLAKVLDVDPAAYDAPTPDPDDQLGIVETELLRRVHAVRDGRFTDAARHSWTRRILARELLGRPGGAAIAVPGDARPWLDERWAEMASAIRDRGFDVVGELDELAWTDPAPGARTLDSVTTQELAETTAWVISRLQEELVERQPSHPPPPVGPNDGVPGILELLEHIRAADTGETPRAPILRKLSAADRLRKTITSALRRH
jgi:hypothetical protein